MWLTSHDEEFREHGDPIAKDDADVSALAEAFVLCNDSGLAPPSAGEPRWRAIGDPTEAALLVFAARAGVDADAVRAGAPRLSEAPFDAESKMMATWHERDARTFVVVKGAPERVRGRCSVRRVNGRQEPLDEAARTTLGAAWEAMAERALRVLAVAVAHDVDRRASLSEIRDATLLGLVGQIDPPREGAREAVDTCRAAGIRVMMVTGDHEATAKAVARTLGILREGDGVLGGAEITRLDDAALARALAHVSVFARVHPAQKLRIVKALQSRGEVVAMTGDGVNDAPALASADVGVAMGRIGTEVAKMASKVILTDDNFATIVGAVEEGRTIHGNLKRLILYLVSTAIAGVTVLLTALTLGLPAPLAAVHILWINLVTDGVVAIPLSTSVVDPGVMKRPPVPRGEPLVTRALLGRIAFMVPAMVLSTLGWVIWRTRSGAPFSQASTEAFTVLASAQWFNALSCRSDVDSAFRVRLARDRWLLLGVGAGVLLQAAALYTSIGNRLLHTVPLSMATLGEVALVGSLVLWVEELRKLIARHSGESATARTAPDRSSIVTAHGRV